MRWLARAAPRDCNLQGWDTGAHTLHSCIHAPDRPPFATNAAPNGTRNQWYFDADTWSTAYYPNAPTFVASALTSNEGAQYYQNSFSALNPVAFNAKSYRLGPFGACYTVWANIAADSVTGNLNTGWVENRQLGLAASATVTLPPGYSTVYFPVFKDVGTFLQNMQVSMQWVRTLDGAVCNRGYMQLNDFAESKAYTLNGYASQVYYAAMVYPVVCHSNGGGSFTVNLYRVNSGPETGPGIWLGRPVVLPTMCSWFITQ